MCAPIRRGSRPGLFNQTAKLLDPGTTIPIWIYFIFHLIFYLIEPFAPFMIAQIAVVLASVIFISLNQSDNNSTFDCPRNYYGDGYLLDLLDRDWCRD
jgi:hypothetical protein